MPVAEQESIDHLTLEQLKAEKVKFGKSHMGKSYAEVWETAPDWVRWFFNHYHTSQNVEHRKVIKFIKMMIEEGESMTATGVNQMPVMPKAKATPKSLMAAPKSRPMSHTDGPIEEMPHQSMHYMEERMANLENALNQILVHLTPEIRSTSPMAEEFPEIPLASEWDDPWAA